MLRTALLFTILVGVSQPSDAEWVRSKAVLAAFQRAHPCPANHQKRGPCPGYVKDHRQAHCVGGKDAIENLQWQTVAEGKAKDRWECKVGWQKKLEQYDIEHAP